MYRFIVFIARNTLNKTINMWESWNPCFISKNILESNRVQYLFYILIYNLSTKFIEPLTAMDMTIWKTKIHTLDNNQL
jgi:hypothetical protein